jgi:hypothetical protein
LVLCTVGLIGAGDTGDFKGDLRGPMGDLSERLGRVAELAEVEMLRDNLGLADREASMLTGFWTIAVDTDMCLCAMTCGD